MDQQAETLRTERAQLENQIEEFKSEQQEKKQLQAQKEQEKAAGGNTAFEAARDAIDGKRADLNEKTTEL